MPVRRLRSWSFALAAGTLAAATAGSAVPAAQQAPAAPAAEVTYSKHIAPILQRSCENCHRAGELERIVDQALALAGPRS